MNSSSWITFAAVAAVLVILNMLQIHEGKPLSCTTSNANLPTSVTPKRAAEFGFPFGFYSTVGVKNFGESCYISSNTNSDTETRNQYHQVSVFNTVSLLIDLTLSGSLMLGTYYLLRVHSKGQS